MIKCRLVHRLQVYVNQKQMTLQPVSLIWKIKCEFVNKITHKTSQSHYEALEVLGTNNLLYYTFQIIPLILNKQRKKNINANNLIIEFVHTDVIHIILFNLYKRTIRKREVKNINSCKQITFFFFFNFFLLNQCIQKYIYIKYK